MRTSFGVYSGIASPNQPNGEDEVELEEHSATIAVNVRARCI